MTKDAKDSEGNTALHHAALTSNRNKVEELLAQHADPNAPNHRGETPLHWAAQGGSAEVVSAVLNAGADPARQDGIGCTPEQTARAGGHIRLADLLRSESNLTMQGPAGRGC